MSKITLSLIGCHAPNDGEIGFSSLKQQYLILNIRYINKIMIYSPFYFYKCPEKILKNTVFKSTFFFRCILIYDIYSLHADFDTLQKI